MKTNITLIGMPGAGKSTTGIILAKNLSLSFLDTDILIQINRQKPLQQILNERGHLYLREIEEDEIMKINIDGSVISTGGSAAYSDRAMNHLRERSVVVFLDVSLDALKRRITNFETRGIAKSADQSFEDLFDERQQLYRRYADIRIDAESGTQDEIAAAIGSAVRGQIQLRHY